MDPEFLVFPTPRVNSSNYPRNNRFRTVLRMLQGSSSEDGVRFRAAATGAGSTSTRTTVFMSSLKRTTLTTKFPLPHGLIPSILHLSAQLMTSEAQTSVNDLPKLSRVSPKTYVDLLLEMTYNLKSTLASP